MASITSTPEQISRCEPEPLVAPVAENGTMQATIAELSTSYLNDHRAILLQLREKLPDHRDFWVECFRVVNAYPKGRLPPDAEAYPGDLCRLAIHKPLYHDELYKTAAFIEALVQQKRRHKPMTKEALCRSQCNQWVHDAALFMSSTAEDPDVIAAAVPTVQNKLEQSDSPLPTHTHQLIDYLAKLGYILSPSDKKKK